ncbi:UDP-N-acetylglucosamine 1-carboxyvinyltransferase [Aurantiacibacter aquimixticola]|uniref:UDP-N-acetylglucosamine 1-carboxyvinyltransferase n=2 Tax=Aurantiacibacter aquimixticola TaxID=1958945 RepID=A0A419RWQ5_9SPHN|nr:UDP-N-acetylglucosamine 1-carboxyvinyltransferase [Aurantiacibacter aquimixticola]
MDGRPCTGRIELAGAKNSALRLLAATLLTSEPVRLTNYPSQLLDAKIHVGMLERLGKSPSLEGEDAIVITEAKTPPAQLEWPGRSIRNTLLILGCLLTRMGEGRVPLPGGCKLGERKYDIHVGIFEKLGARVWEEGDDLCAKTDERLVGADIHLPIRSTGATENAILCGTLAKGVTRVWNPHVRPEILDLVGMLRSMGAKIEVFGQEHIRIDGVETLSGCDHRVIPDNMEAITWLVAAVITGGDVEIADFPYADLEVVLAHLTAAGARLFRSENSLIVRGGRPYPLEISTGPHPGINSDVQPILAAWAAAALGESRIVDLRFPGRYAYAAEMQKLGVQYAVEGDLLTINGAGIALKGGRTKALDLRAGAALALCGLIAKGTTTIEDAWQIGRGYVNFGQKLRSLGVEVELGRSAAS